MVKMNSKVKTRKQQTLKEKNEKDKINRKSKTKSSAYRINLYVGDLIKGLLKALLLHHILECSLEM